MKVVINACFGGFGLSPEATLELWRRGGPVRAYPARDYYGDRWDSDSTLGGKRALEDWRAYLADPKAKEGRRSLFLTVFSPDESQVLHANDDYEERSNPLLVALVEEMGEAASGDCAKLRVVEIPDGTDYEISEYDGSEHIAEKHRTWA